MFSQLIDRFFWSYKRTNDRSCYNRNCCKDSSQLPCPFCRVVCRMRKWKLIIHTVLCIYWSNQMLITYPICDDKSQGPEPQRAIGYHWGQIRRNSRPTASSPTTSSLPLMKLAWLLSPTLQTYLSPLHNEMESTKVTNLKSSKYITGK